MFAEITTHLCLRKPQKNDTRKLFRICTYTSVSKQRTLSLLESALTQKPGGGGIMVNQQTLTHSLLRYVCTICLRSTACYICP